jgi:hypothetical protein
MSNSIICYALIHLCAILAKMSIVGTLEGILIATQANKQDAQATLAMRAATGGSAVNER